MKQAIEFLNAIFANTNTVEVQFDAEKHLGATGYMEHMAEIDLELEVGTVFKAHTGSVNNRKIVGIVTPVGNVVFFERYTGGTDGVVVVNAPYAMSGMIESGAQTWSTMDHLFGGVEGYRTNIGKIMGRVVSLTNAGIAREPSKHDHIVKNCLGREDICQQ